MHLDRPHLELLAAIAAHGQLGAAAERINLSASAASRRLAEAERRVGARLTETRGRNIVLTASGRLLAEAAAEIIQALAEAELGARWLNAGGVRPLRLGLGFHDTLAARIDPTGRPPLSLLRVAERDLHDALRRGELDIAVDATAAPPRHLAAHHLADDRLVAILPRDSALAALDRPLRAADFAAMPYLVSGLEPKAGFEYDSVFRHEGVSPSRIVTVESMRLVCDHIARGLGASIQPALAVAGESGVAVRELEARVAIRWYALTQPGPGAPLKTLIAHLQAMLMQSGDPPIRLSKGSP